MRKTCFAGAAAAMLLAFPAGAVEFSIPVRSIDEVAAGSMPEIGEITATEATLLFDSSVPLVCSVVFGETSDFGLISTDQDMAGGAHSNHHPALLGLRPDTEYFWRVQGTAADGTVYLGETLTFRTPVQVASAQPNLASMDAGATIREVSSNFGGGNNDAAWGADSAIDGSRSTAWSSFGDGNDAFVEIALGSPSEIEEIEVWTRTMSDGTAQIFSFTVSTDTGDVFGPFDLPDAAMPYRFPVQTTAQSLRLEVVDSSGGNVGLIEFGAYGRASP